MLILLDRPKKISNGFYKSLEIVARVIGQVKKGLTPVSFVETRLPLLKLPEEILVAIRKGEIEYTKAKSIAKIGDPEKRIEILAQAIDEKSIRFG